MRPPVVQVLSRDRVFHAILFVLLGVIVAALFLISTVQREDREAIPYAVRSRLDPSLFAEGLPAGLTGRLERFEAAARESFPGLRAVAVSLPRDRDWQVVYPPFTRELPEGAATVPLLEGGREVARLHLVLGLTPFQVFVTAAPWLALAITLVVFASVYGRGRRQARRIAESRVELARRQEEIIRLERMALIGQLTAGILHDLKKPVLHIRDEVRELPDSPHAKEIREQTDLFIQLLREADIEGFLRSESAREEFVDPVEMVERSINLVRYQSDGAEFDIHMSAELPFVFGIRHRLIQVFSNLFLNALQATEGRGRIQVTAGVSSYGGEEWLDISVSDSGPGIPEDVRRRIFDPLFSTRKEGTGLGLYIVRSVMEDLGGRVEVQSQVGRGTTFRVSFPVKREMESS